VHCIALNPQSSGGTPHGEAQSQTRAPHHNGKHVLHPRARALLNAAVLPARVGEDNSKQQRGLMNATTRTCRLLAAAFLACSLTDVLLAQAPPPTPPPAPPASAPTPSKTPPAQAAPPKPAQGPGVKPTPDAPPAPAQAAPGQPPRSEAGQPAQSAATQAAPATPPPARAPVVSGGGNAPHGALAMERQLAQLEAWIGATPRVQRPSSVSPSFWSMLLPTDNAQPTEAQIALGRKLFFDPRLSKDGTVSCATCHDVSRGFADRRALFEGFGDNVGRRNSPTVLNALFFSTQFWDGRAPTLEEQAKLPITNPIEMGQPDAAAAVAAISGDPSYASAFQAAYGRGVNFDDLARAIAAFERTLVFLDAPFDRFARGDAGAISADARAGWALFQGKGRCTSCHQISSSSPLGSDGRFHNVGVSARHQDFEALAKRALAALEKDSSAQAIDELALQTDLAELGRFVVTRNRADIGAFKTSQVRNVGVTAPYMHDGSMATLWDVMDHYNKGGEANPYLDGGMEPLALSELEINQIVAFLFTLTDDRLAEQNRSEWERQRAIAAKRRPFRDDALAQRKVLLFERRVQGQAPPPQPPPSAQQKQPGAPQAQEKR
jgi:cytochrome c peroxidase